MNTPSATALKLGWLRFCLCLIVVMGCSRSSPKFEAENASSDISIENAPLAVSTPTRTDEITPPGQPLASGPVVASASTLPMPIGFVGSQRCAQCHAEQAQSFEATPHARSLRTAVAVEEPTCESFLHPLSRQRMSVVSRDGSLHHLGWQQLPPSDEQIPIGDARIRYIIGSGTFAKSYLFVDGTSWLQAPLTYYVSQQAYDLSPGYDRPQHKGFSRQLTDECLFCHAGVVSRNNQNPSDFNVHELAIGCERCHGAGAKHAELFASSDVPVAGSADQDWHIVHPARLTRDQLESLCAQCHLQGKIQLYVDDTDAWSFTPGDILGQGKIIYAVGPQHETVSEKATGFVGHFEQLRMSKCYQGSETLTCVTCHDPHQHAGTGADQDRSQRHHCASCHQDEHCGVELKQRILHNENQCWQCHMPRQDSEVPHIAITNHRIAVYKDSLRSVPADVLAPTLSSLAQVPGMSVLPVATPLLDESPINSPQRQLNVAVATSMWMALERDEQFHNLRSFNAAISQLRSAIQAIDDSEKQTLVRGLTVSRATAGLCLAELLEIKRMLIANESDTQQDQQLIREIQSLAQACLASTDRADALTTLTLALLASTAMDSGEDADAYSHFNKLVRLRRESADYYNLGIVCGRMRRFSEAQQAFMEAIRIQSNNPLPYASLGRLYESIDPQQAAMFFRLSEYLRHSPSK